LPGLATNSGKSRSSTAGISNGFSPRRVRFAGRERPRGPHAALHASDPAEHRSCARAAPPRAVPLPRLRSCAAQGQLRRDPSTQDLNSRGIKSILTVTFVQQYLGKTYYSRIPRYNLLVGKNLPVLDLSAAAASW
jgi:hypothetical protein